jgi:PAS domain S-box-containing protein
MLTAVGLVAFLVLLGAWARTEVLFQRQIKVLINAVQRLTSGDLTVRTNIQSGADEVKLLGYHFDRLTETLKQEEVEHSRSEERLKRSAGEEASLGALSGALQGKLTISEASEKALISIAQFLGASMGTLFVLEEDGLFHRRAAYALPTTMISLTTIPVGSGSIGLAARSRQMVITKPNNQAWELAYGFGEMTPRQVITFPLIANDILTGVLELCFFNQLSEDQTHWLSKASEITATALRFAREGRERELAEQALREREHDFRTLFECSPIGLTHKSADGVILDCNEEYLKQVGASREKMIGFNVLDQGNDPLMIEMTRRGINGERVEYETSFTSIISGQTLDWHVIINPVNPGQSPTDIITAHEDISARKQAEEEVRQRNAELETFNQAMIGRESRVIELKEEINALCARLGAPPAYPPVWEDSEEGLPKEGKR